MRVTESDVQSFLEDGCPHEANKSPLEDVCIDCLSKYFRRCKTDINRPEEHPDCQRVFVPQRLIDKYCPTCFKTVRRGMRS